MPLSLVMMIQFHMFETDARRCRERWSKSAANLADNGLKGAKR